ncbi:MAG: hypothetical protein AVDCRST_MAG78-3449, partial [uncultured Rubrobacteraceae bacterium]
DGHRLRSESQPVEPEQPNPPQATGCRRRQIPDGVRGKAESRVGRSRWIGEILDTRQLQARPRQGCRRCGHLINNERRRRNGRRSRDTQRPWKTASAPPEGVGQAGQRQARRNHHQQARCGVRGQGSQREEEIL